jgi:hypothetical protein
MKIAFDFENRNCVSKALEMVLASNVSSIGEADVVITESVNKVLYYMQNTDKKVVQFAFSHHHPMVHLLEDYPHRLRVVLAEMVSNTLKATVEAIQELCK